MEDEIDLRAYVAILLRHWLWIAGLAVGAALVAFVVTTLQPKEYEARSVVFVTEPRYQMQFDPRFESTTGWRPAYQAFPRLATSDEVLQHVVDTYTPSPRSGIETWSLAALAGMVEASSEGDPSLLVLKVTSRSAEDAAGIANAWATALVEQASQLFGDTEEDVAFFEAQKAEAERNLQAAEANLIAFEAGNPTGTLNAHLNSLRQAQADYLADQRHIAAITQDIRGLRQQLADKPDSQEVSLGDSLTALFLQIKAFNAQASTPLQIQVDDQGAITDRTPAEQVAFLDNLAAGLAAKSAEIDDRLAELEPQALELQRQLQEVQAEQSQQVRLRDVAQETYLTLARKLDEAWIAAQEEDAVMQVGSQAAVPAWPVDMRLSLVVVVGGLLGSMVGIAGAFLLEFWRQPGLDSKTGESPAQRLPSPRT